MGDAGRLIRILSNLLGNSLSYMAGQCAYSSGGVPSKIKILFKW